jgi:hypothetical protein
LGILRHPQPSFLAIPRPPYLSLPVSSLRVIVIPVNKQLFLSCVFTNLQHKYPIYSSSIPPSAAFEQFAHCTLDDMCLQDSKMLLQHFDFVSGKKK